MKRVPRRAALVAVLVLLAGCVLLGVVPSAVALSQQGWRSWTDVTPFEDGSAQDGGTGGD